MKSVLYQINHAQIRNRVLQRRSAIAKLPGGLIMLNLIINRQYDISDILDVEKQLDKATAKNTCIRPTPSNIALGRCGV